MDELSILVLDPRDVCGVPLAQAAQRLGYRWSRAATVEQVFDAVRSDTCGCLLASADDVDRQSLHELVGNEAMRGLTGQIYFTDRNSTSFAFWAAKNGVVDLLTTPVDCGRLQRAIEESMRSARIGRDRQATQESFRCRLELLTRRERETVAALARGLSIKQIASREGICQKTVAKHRSRALQKMGADNDVELVQMMFDAGHLEDSSQDARAIPEPSRSRVRMASA